VWLRRFGRVGHGTDWLCMAWDGLAGEARFGWVRQGWVRPRRFGTDGASRRVMAGSGKVVQVG
jgi:hypothetical protein